MERTLEKEIKANYMEILREVKDLKMQNACLQETVHERESAIQELQGMEVQLQGMHRQLSGLELENRTLRTSRERMRRRHLREMSAVLADRDRRSIMTRRQITLGFGVGIALGGLTMLLAAWEAL